MKRLYTAILILLVTLFVSVTISDTIFADTHTINSDTVAQYVFPYIELDESDYPTVNVEAMKENNVPQEYINIGIVFNEVGVDYTSSNLTIGSFIEARMAYTPTYGNWCGGGHTMGDRNGLAIDLLDHACKEHDLCYRDNGQWNAKCDIQFIKKLKSLLDSGSIHGRTRTYAAGAYAFFAARRSYWG